MKKQFLAVLLVLTMVLSLCPVFAAAANSGSCGEHTNWTLDEAGTLTISGTGATDSFYPFLSDREINPAPWTDDMGNIQRVVVEDGVTELGSWAFMAAGNLKSVSLPESLTKLGEGTFNGCDSLREIKLPSKCTEIGSFQGCAALESVTLPPALEVVPAGCFDSCTSLKAIDLPSTVRELGEYCFAATAITELRIPDGVTELPPYLCHDCTSLKTVTFSDAVTALRMGCFEGCSALQTVSDSKNLKELESSAFSGCESLKAFRLPDGMTEIPYMLFFDCASLKEVDIPETVTVIQGNAFSGCRGLTEVELPAGLTEIGVGAFCDCSRLQYIILPPQTRSIGRNAFSSCIALEAAIVPDSVTEMGEGVFYQCSKLQTFRVPSKITILPASTFCYCASLEYVAIPAGLKQIDALAFNDCPALKGLEYPGTEAQLRRIAVEPDGNEVLANVTTYLIPAYPDYLYGLYDMPAEDNWAYDGIAFCLDTGLMQGMGEGYFRPNGTTTRAQLVTILWRMCDEPKAAKPMPFTDCGISWADPAIAWASENGIVSGLGNGKFGPNQPITREQLVTIFYRFCKEYLELDVSKTQSISTFADAKTVSDWAKDAMQWGTAVKLISGVASPKGTLLQPGGNATRAQIARIILNFVTNVAPV